jgi:glycosyltransferase involved in cell wall biosynthesis
VPIVIGYGGPAELVSPGSGFIVPVGGRASIIAGVRRQLQALVDDPGVLEGLASQARARVMRYFTWDAKAEQIEQVYRWVCGQRAKPEFGMPLSD